MLRLLVRNGPETNQHENHKAGNRKDGQRSSIRPIIRATVRSALSAAAIFKTSAGGPFRLSLLADNALPAPNGGQPLRGAAVSDEPRPV